MECRLKRFFLQAEFPNFCGLDDAMSHKTTNKISGLAWARDQKMNRWTDFNQEGNLRSKEDELNDLVVVTG